MRPETRVKHKATPAITLSVTTNTYWDSLSTAAPELCHSIDALPITLNFTFPDLHGLLS